MLNRERAKCAADLFNQTPAVVPVTDKHANFDQLVMLEAAVDLVKQGRRETRLADAQVRSQVVGTGPERAANG